MLFETARDIGELDEQQTQTYFGNDGAVRSDYIQKWVNRWMEQNKLVVRSKNWTQSIGYTDAIRKLGAFWRNVIRIRCHFAGVRIEIDAYGRSPFWRRMASQKTVAFAGERAVAVVDDAQGDRGRYTVVAPSAADITNKFPEILFKGQRPDATLLSVKGVTVQYKTKATYCTKTTLQMLLNKYSYPNMRDVPSRRPRIIMFDSFSGQLGNTVLKQMIALNKIPVCIWGGLTLYVQGADRYEISRFKALYRAEEQKVLMQKMRRQTDEISRFQGLYKAEEQEDLRQRMRQQLDGTVSSLNLSKEQIAMCVKEARRALISQKNYAVDVKQQFKLIGADVVWGGSEDDCIDARLRPFWDDEAICNWGGNPCSMSEWRRLFIASLPPESERVADITQLFSEMDNPYRQEMPSRHEIDQAELHAANFFADDADRDAVVVAGNFDAEAHTSEPEQAEGAASSSANAPDVPVEILGDAFGGRNKKRLLAERIIEAKDDKRRR